MINNKSVIAENIKKYRKKKSITKNKLSKIADITCNAIIEIESERIQNTTIETLARVAKALDVKADDLIKK